MEQNKDQSGAVIAWMRPGEIDGLLESAKSESATRQYGRVYAKQYSPDMVPVCSAAVRGEAVAEPFAWAYQALGSNEWRVTTNKAWAHAFDQDFVKPLFDQPLSPRAADAPSEPSEPEKLNTDESREYLVKFMMQHFTDKTFHGYIRGPRDTSLAGDFAWQMARAMRMVEAGIKSRAADALDSQPKSDLLSEFLAEAKTSGITHLDFSALDSQPTDQTAELESLGAEVARLQDALCFWLPSVTEREDEVALRILDDAFLLVGADGNLPPDFKSAQELGWIALQPASSQPTDGGVRNG